MDDTDQTAELVRLRAEVARLREAAKARRRWRLRATAAAALIALAAVLSPLAVVARWAHAEVSDTDRYVETVAPLARDPAVRAAITDRVSTEILSRVDIPALVRRALAALAGQLPQDRVLAGALPALATPLANGIQSFVHEAVGRIVDSDQFAVAWEQANRAAHEQLAGVLTGSQQGAVQVRGDAVSVSLAALIATVKQDLVARGFELAARIPEVDASFVIFQSADVPRAQRGFALLSRLAAWLPLLALIAAGSGIYLSRDRRRALLTAAVSVGAGMAVLAAGLAVLRPVYLDALPVRVSRAAAGAVFDALCRPMRSSARTVLILAALVALAAALAGPSAPARRVRAGAGIAAGWLRRRSSALGEAVARARS